MPSPSIPEWWERLVARVIDGILFGVVQLVLSAILVPIFLFTTSFTLAFVLPMLLGGLGFATYDFAMHSRDGQTLGKIVMRIRVVGVDGCPPDQTTLLKRATVFPGLMAVVGLFGFLGVTGGQQWLLVVVFSLVDGIFVITEGPLRRALHDRWTDTIVIKAQ